MQELITEKGVDMKTAAGITAILATMVSAATAVAASGAENEGVSILMILFMGFGAMIISFQGILVAVLLFSMVKALFTKPLKDASALAVETSKHGS